MARPTKFDEARSKRICDLLRAGGTRKAAAACAGVSFMSFLRWQKRYESFVTDVSRAEADAENIHAATFQKAALSGDWRASESWLKRRRPEEWGTDTSCRGDRVNMSGLSGLSGEELLQAAYR
jgi:hypothetical protein